MEVQTTDKVIKVFLNAILKNGVRFFEIIDKRMDTCSDLIGSQRDTPPTAATETALAVAAGMAAAIRKLGFPTDSAGGRLWPGHLGHLRLLPQRLHLVLVQLKLLMQLPVEWTEAAWTEVR